MRVNVANIKPTNLFGDDENTLTKKQLLIWAMSNEQVYGIWIRIPK